MRARVGVEGGCVNASLVTILGRMLSSSIGMGSSAAILSNVLRPDLACLTEGKRSVRSCLYSVSLNGVPTQVYQHSCSEARLLVDSPHIPAALRCE